MAPASKLSALVLFMAAAAEPAVMTRALRPRDDYCANYGTTLDHLTPICYKYCEKSSTRVNGPPVKVGADINCDTSAGCSDQHSSSVQITQSFSINLGVSVDSDKSPTEVLKGGASAGVGWSWSQTTGTSDTWSFNLGEGDAGYVQFTPYLQQSCGEMSFFGTTCVDTEGMNCSCNETPYSSDPNACGTTPIILSTGLADGVFQFCYTAGPKAGNC